MGCLLQDCSDESYTVINTTVPCLTYYCFGKLELIHVVTLEVRGRRRT